MTEFKALGKSGAEYDGTLETISMPSCPNVTYTSDEVTALCPVTGQPDWYTVTITIRNSEFGLESKSLKLFLQSLRETGIFCESLAEFILVRVFSAISPSKEGGTKRPQKRRVVIVNVVQKPRGGISISATLGVNNE